MLRRARALWRNGFARREGGAVVEERAHCFARARARARARRTENLPHGMRPKGLRLIVRPGES